MNTENSLTRRDLFKKTAGGALAVAALAAGMNAGGVPTLAQHATQGASFFEGAVPNAFAAPQFADGIYRINANMLITKNFVLIKKNAYYTNPTDPNINGDKPEFPNTSLNATLEVKSGKMFVTVPLVNDCFMLLQTSTTKDTGARLVKTTTVTSKYQDKHDKPLVRVNTITFELLNTSGTYPMGKTSSYAAYQHPPFPMSLRVPGYLDWPATLKVDFSTAVKE